MHYAKTPRGEVEMVEVLSDGYHEEISEKEGKSAIRKKAAAFAKDPSSGLIVKGSGPIYDKDNKVVAVSALAVTTDEQKVIDAQVSKYGKNKGKALGKKK